MDPLGRGLPLICGGDFAEKGALHPPLRELLFQDLDVPELDDPLLARTVAALEESRPEIIVVNRFFLLWKARTRP